MDQNQLKHAVAQAACDLVMQELPSASVLGVGTGSTANCFIDAIAAAPTLRSRLAGCVASSEATRQRLLAHGLQVLELNEVVSRNLPMPLYVDGADEIDGGLNMIKGGGGALTREKIVAAVAGRFICICDASKQVEVLGRFPLPVEVIPMALAQVGRAIQTLTGGEPRLRSGFTTDNGNQILDIHGLEIHDPKQLEQQLDGIVGVVCNGLFAARGADVLLLAGTTGVQQFQR